MMTTAAAKLETITSCAGLLLDGPKSHMSCPLPHPNDKSAVERVGRGWASARHHNFVPLPLHTNNKDSPYGRRREILVKQG
jgi:hypothetical protein